MSHPTAQPPAQGGLFQALTPGEARVAYHWDGEQLTASLTRPQTPEALAFIQRQRGQTPQKGENA
jgi:hypothetical protein